MATNFPTSLDSFFNPTTSNTLDSPSHSGQHSDLNDAVEAVEAKLGIGASPAGSASANQVLMALTDGTTAWSTITSLINTVLTAPEEAINIIATASSGTVNADLKTSGVTFATANASGNWVMNLRGDGTATANSLIAVGQSISHVYMNTNGTGVFYPTSYTVDGTAVTPRWQAGGTPTTGNANSIDAYAFTIMKTAATPTYTVLASQTRFA
jgi:uncharacterized protein GlcG (DUF336 family)